MKMQKKINETFILVINILLILLTLAFIWSRSLKSIPESRAESEAVLNVVRPPLEIVVGEGNVTDHLVRKLAHFSEFGLLGAEISALVWQCWGYRRKTVMLLLLSGFLCGAIDETIQIFTERGNQLSDVLLDFAGFAFGAMMIYMFCVISKKSEASKTK